MTDIPTDKYYIDKIYEVSGVDYFNDALQPILRVIIRELYYYNQALAFKLRINHIDRAIYKYRQAKGNNRIWNTKQYFKACIISAIHECGLDELELIEN